MAKIVNDNLQYAKAVLKMGMRSSAATEDFSDIMPDDVEAAMKASSAISMGTDISEQDLSSIKELCNQVCVCSPQGVCKDTPGCSVELSLCVCVCRLSGAEACLAESRCVCVCVCLPLRVRWCPSWSTAARCTTT